MFVLFMSNLLLTFWVLLAGPFEACCHSLRLFHTQTATHISGPLIVTQPSSLCSFWIMEHLSSSSFTSVGKLWDGCHGSMPPTVVTWCLKATCCCCFLYVAYFPDVGTVGNNDCCCRSNDVGNFFLPFPHLSLSPIFPPFFFCIPLSYVEM